MTTPFENVRNISLNQIIPAYDQFDPNDLQHFQLFLMCSDFPRKEELLNSGKTEITPDLKKWIEQQQKSDLIACEMARVYYGSNKEKLKPLKTKQEIVSYAQTANIPQYGTYEYVVYKSIVAKKLIKDLKDNAITPDKIGPASGWFEEAQKLDFKSFGYIIDENGGRYGRSFPVVYVYTKNESGIKGDDLVNLMQSLHSYASSIFYRQIDSDSLVTSFKVGFEETEANSFEMPIGDSGDSCYCAIYDFTKIYSKGADADNKLYDLLKISLPVFSRGTSVYYDNKDKFKSSFMRIKKHLLSKFDPDDFIDFAYKIESPERTLKEAVYITEKSEGSLNPKISNPLKIQFDLLLRSYEDVLRKYISVFTEETSGNNKKGLFYTYQDGLDYRLNFYHDEFNNLLGVTTTNPTPKEKKKEYDSQSPFNLEQYDVNNEPSNLVSKFYKNVTDYDDPTSLYKFYSNLDEDLVFVTDIFLKKLYSNYEPSSGDKFVSGLSATQAKDIPCFDLKGIIDKVVNDPNLILEEKEKYFIKNGNQITLKKSSIRVLRSDELTTLFDGTKVDHINLQTINNISFSNLELLKQIPESNTAGVLSFIYYPRLTPQLPPPEPPKPIGKDPSKVKDKKNDKKFFINNIITSELKCYEDILKSFEKANEAETAKDKAYYASQAVFRLGLPILLALAAKATADMLAKKHKVDPDTAECVNSNQEDIKQSILSSADIIANLQDPRKLLGFTTQGMTEMIFIPPIQYLATFDAFQQLKKMLINYAVGLVIKFIGEQLKIAIKPIIDMCNSDSYLTSFLDQTFPNPQTSGRKLTSPTPSGLLAGSSGLYIPSIHANINALIDETNAETRENVYSAFRQKYQVNDGDYSDSDISSFFDYISDSVDVGQMVTLLRGSANLETRSIVSSYIKNYSNKRFGDIIQDEKDVAFLFEFISLYVDYRLCYQTLANSTIDFSGAICEDLNSEYDDNVDKFGLDATVAEIADLSNALNDLCKMKNPVEFDVLKDGPSLGVFSDLNVVKPFEHTISVLSYTSPQITEQNKKIDTLTSLFPGTTNNYKFVDESIASKLINLMQKDVYDNQDIYYLIKQFTLISSEYRNSVLNSQNIKDELSAAGNSGLQTDEQIFHGYVQRLNQIMKEDLEVL